ncbi:hypothetical protein B566_EDAN002608 [Ephemera danica]|nr:hypothetical protein B566_EDAN002608 [Ephemera danica]
MTDVSFVCMLQQQKYLKRNSEELQDAGPGGAGAGDFEPPPKMQCTSGPPGPQQQQQTGGPPRAGNNQQQQQQQQQGSAQNSSGGNEGLTKFSVEIVQQLEFTTSAANSQPQQISTNVTVKALTNTSVKSDISSSASPAASNERGPTPKSNPPTPASSAATPGSTQSSAAPSSQQQGAGRPNAAACVDLGSLVECKQEPGESEFVDLEQCAAALEKDAAAAFPGFSDLIGDDTNDEIITSDAFKDLISEISDFHPEFMKDLGFEEKPVLLNDHHQQRDQHHHDSSTDSSSIAASMGGMLEHSSKLGVHSPGNIGQQQFSPQPGYGGDNMNKQGPRIQAYSGLDFKSELRPAAQTLKQMAEQHQHKTQLGMSFGPAAAAAAVAVAAAGGNAAGGGARNVRSPYGEFFPTGNEASFMHSPTSGPPPPYLSKQQAGFGPDLVGMQQCNAGFTMEQKRQMAAMQQQQQAKMNFGPTKQTPQQATPQQPFSPYGSPNHGSPQYMARGQQPGPQPTPQQQQQPPPPFGGSTPPHRPPSLPPAASLHISQAQQMHVTQQTGPNQMQYDSHVNGILKLRCNPQYKCDMRAADVEG